MSDTKTKIVYTMFKTAAIIGITKLIAMASMLSFVAKVASFDYKKEES